MAVVDVCQLPRRESYVFGLHVVLSVLRLATSKLHTAAWSTNQGQASQETFIRLHCADGESRNDDSTHCVSSVTSHASSSSRHHFLLLPLILFSLKTSLMSWTSSVEVSDMLAVMRLLCNICITVLSC